MTGKKTEDMQAQDTRGEEYVTVQLFKDGGKYSDDVFVSVNGENCLVKRGIPVSIRRKFAETLENSLRQDEQTAQIIQGLSN